VSESIADLLEAELGLHERPTVVRNLPELSARAQPAVGLRQAVGVPDAPLVVYSGGVSARRGIDIAVQAVALLDDVFLALVVPPDHRYTLELLELANELRIRDRVRVTPLVPVDQVVRFLESASVGIHTPRDDGVNHVALPNKLFEYLHAGLPIVGSDLGEQARFIRGCRIGEVCQVDDPGSCAGAIRRVLSDPARYLEGRAALIEQWSWEAQLPALENVYSRLVG
jgi:glycosyltransferase involved in cell wall biosynthesis